MMNKQTAGRTSIGVIFALTLLAGTFAITQEARADSGAALMLAPWEEGNAFELDADLFVQSRGRVRQPGGERVRINTYESSGRFRFDTESRHSPAIGYDFYHVDFNHDGSNLPERLSDQSVGVGFGIGEWEGWEIGATAGFGFAGDLPYSDQHAWYAKGNLIASRELDPHTSLQLVLNYDGNRSILPDVPLPGIAYTRRVSETFTYTAGIPYSAITWKPMPKLTVDARLALLYNASATVTYELMDSLDIFGAFYNRYTGFHVKDDDSNRRMFFRQRRVEAGVRYSRSENWELMAAAGYAFDQELRRGWDVRDLSTPTKFTSEPYLRVGFDVTF
ncbi:MAG: hypothetical protein WD294_11165 [Phycisphaeraceae bacterium]